VLTGDSKKIDIASFTPARHDYGTARQHFYSRAGGTKIRRHHHNRLQPAEIVMLCRGSFDAE
jgi:hypothetical protein